MGSIFDSPAIVAFARQHRRKPTEAEAKLWRELRRKGLGRRRRQLVVGRMIVDLALPKRNLLIEVDGSSHTDPERDARRDAFLRGLGFNVLRVTNFEVMCRMWTVIDRIKEYPEEIPRSEKYCRAMRLARQCIPSGR